MAKPYCDVILVQQKLGVPQGKIGNRLMTERCSELMLAAIVNRCAEVWISTQPLLLMTYLGQYAPGILKW